MAVSPDRQLTPDEQARVARVIAMYEEIGRELTALEKEGKVLRNDIQKAIDEGKMKEVLQKIVHSS